MTRNETNHREILSPDTRSKKMAGIVPGYPVVGRWRRCTSPGTNCMFRYDLNVPVNDEEHGYVDVIKILVCPLYMKEITWCPANKQVPRQNLEGDGR